ncbi:MAG: hypothetical protein JNK87_32600 [Bryobacterales bacterium]|nr:hypothetical protein [Bryobacterales bacterium]
MEFEIGRWYGDRLARGRLWYVEVEPEFARWGATMLRFTRKQLQRHEVTFYGNRVAIAYLGTQALRYYESGGRLVDL